MTFAKRCKTTHSRWVLPSLIAFLVFYCNFVVFVSCLHIQIFQNGCYWHCVSICFCRQIKIHMNGSKCITGINSQQVCTLFHLPLICILDFVHFPPLFSNLLPIHIFPEVLLDGFFSVKKKHAEVFMANNLGSQLRKQLCQYISMLLSVLAYLSLMVLNIAMICQNNYKLTNHYLACCVRMNKFFLNNGGRF